MSFQMAVKRNRGFSQVLHSEPSWTLLVFFVDNFEPMEVPGLRGLQGV